MSNSDPLSHARTRAPIALDDCGMALATDLIGDRWTLLILREALYGVVRYDDMRADLGAPRSMLTDRLSKLVDTGLMTRQPYQEPGSRTRQAYVLTPSGKALALPLLALMEWSDEHVRTSPRTVEMIDTETGQPVSIRPVTSQGEAIPLTRVTLKPVRSA